MSPLADTKNAAPFTKLHCLFEDEGFGLCESEVVGGAAHAVPDAESVGYIRWQVFIDAHEEEALREALSSELIPVAISGLVDACDLNAISLFVGLRERHLGLGVEAACFGIVEAEFAEVGTVDSECHAAIDGLFVGEDAERADFELMFVDELSEDDEIIAFGDAAYVSCEAHLSGCYLLCMDRVELDLRWDVSCGRGVVALVVCV